MRRIFEHGGFIVDVQTRTDSRVPNLGERPFLVGYFALVKVRRRDVEVATFCAVRLGTIASRGFVSEADGVEAGYDAARGIIDDVLYVA